MERSANGAERERSGAGTVSQIKVLQKYTKMQKKIAVTFRSAPFGAVTFPSTPWHGCVGGSCNTTHRKKIEWKTKRLRTIAGTFHEIRKRRGEIS